MKHVLPRAALLGAIASLLLVTQPVFAQGAMTKQLQARFAAADRNHDGKLTKSEAKDGMPRVAQAFEQIDTDNTGSVSLAQITAFMATLRR